MKRMQDKDLYLILGVDNKATQEELRDAYVARARVIHPDRFDQQKQPQDWKKANEMLSELNEAYAILRDLKSRAEYDRSHSPNADGKASESSGGYESSTSSPPIFEFGELTRGTAKYADLPKRVQEKLLNRQKNIITDQFQVRLASIAWNYAFVPALLCWFWYLFADADGAKWKGETLLWYAACTVIVGILVGRNLIAIVRWTTSTLKPFFYITPIYYIKTEYDLVSYRPIWMLKDIVITDNVKNGSYVNSDVVFKFDGYSETVRFSSKRDVEVMLDCIKSYDATIRKMFELRNFEFFRQHDDFFQVPRTHIHRDNSLRKSKQISIYFFCIFFSAIGLLTAVALNNDLSQKRWFRHASPPAYEPALPSPSRLKEKTPLIPEQPLPRTGSVRKHAAGALVAPFQIKAAQGNNYLVKLVDTYSRSLVLTVFVRSGTTVDIKVPLGSYEVKYAAGKRWFGYEYLFGVDTIYSKADKIFTFEIADNQISGYSITLYKVAHGNLHTMEIKPEEF